MFLIFCKKREEKSEKSKIGVKSEAKSGRNGGSDNSEETGETERRKAVRKRGKEVCGTADGVLYW